MGYCEYPGCEKPAKERLCAMHARRKRRRQLLSAPMDVSKSRDPAVRPPSPWAAFLEAQVALMQTPAEDDGAWHRAEQRVREAGEAWLVPILAARIHTDRAFRREVEGWLRSGRSARRRKMRP